MAKSATTGGKTFISHSEAETKAFAVSLAKKIRSPKVIALFGDLGAGKTVFAKGFAKGLGIRERHIKSPTFILMHEHAVPQSKNRRSPVVFFHCDFYRVKTLDVALTEHLQEIFSQKNAVVLIEWADRAEKILPRSAVRITIFVKNDRERKILLS